MRYALAVLCSAVAIAVAGCSGSGEGNGGDEPPDQPIVADVSVEGFAFAPDVLTVAVGTTVTWSNADSVTHTVTSATDAWPSTRVDGGATFSTTFEEAGTFDYHCSIHPSMTGTITVTG